MERDPSLMSQRHHTIGLKALSAGLAWSSDYHLRRRPTRMKYDLEPWRFRRLLDRRGGGYVPQRRQVRVQLRHLHELAQLVEGDPLVHSGQHEAVAQHSR